MKFVYQLRLYSSSVEQCFDKALADGSIPSIATKQSQTKCERTIILVVTKTGTFIEVADINF